MRASFGHAAVLIAVTSLAAGDVAQAERHLLMPTARIAYGMRDGWGFSMRRAVVTYHGAAMIERRWERGPRMPWRDSTWHTQLSVNDYRALVSRLSLPELLTLTPIIGCPNCSDGGIEWIEIELPGIGYRCIVFEYKNAPPALEPLVNLLRGYAGVVLIDGYP